MTSRRRTAVNTALADVRSIAGGASVDRPTLARITARLEQLAWHGELFNPADFPPPAAEPGTGGYTLYRLNEDDGDCDIALYLNSINPGETSIPHDHTTWATIVALQGQEKNLVYRRIDDGRDFTTARLEVAREVTVEPGTSIGLLPDELHSIHVIGDVPVLHFHLYGRPLATLLQRIGVDPHTGSVVNYNAALLASARAVQ